MVKKLKGFPGIRLLADPLSVSKGEISPRIRIRILQ